MMLLHKLRLPDVTERWRLKRRREAEAQLVAGSPLFDPEWYLLTYADVARAGIDPLAHYLESGWREGRDPSPGFGTSAYLRANADVAAAGTNPLVHYIEFGHSEGRESFGHRPSAAYREPPVFDFADPHPCLSFELPIPQPVRWDRSYRLDKDHPDRVMIGDLLVGYAARPAVREKVENAFALLAELCGAPARARISPEQKDGTERLRDSWFVNATQLRTRWDRTDFPVVVRAYQYQPGESGRLSLVAESLLSSPLDFADMHLKNPYWPVLIAFAEADGHLRGARILAFPSLCRGGAHYPEALRRAGSRPGDGDVDPMGEGDRLANQLLAITRGDAPAAVAAIAVDVADANATGPLFQPDFKAWLEQVMRVPVSAVQKSDDYATTAVRTEASDDLRSSGAILVIAHDMVPTVCVLTEPQPATEPAKAAHSPGASADVALPLLLAGEEPSGPARLVDLPNNAFATFQRLGAREIRAWPHLEDAAKIGVLPPSCAGAIRLSSGKAPSDAQLMVPIADASLAEEPGDRPAITWVLSEDGWYDGGIADAVHLLDLQDGSGCDAIAFVGKSDPAGRPGAAGRFEGRVRHCRDVQHAIECLDTPLAAFLGAGVLLHDRRTASALGKLLRDDLVLTASCVAISVERHGKSWKASVRDAGTLSTSGRSDPEPVREAFCAGDLWRMTYPVASPSPSLWIARSSAVKRWALAAPSDEPADGLHLCTGAIATTIVGKAPTGSPAFAPKACPANVANLEVFFG